LFDYATHKTKFGSCGIKVWVSYKKNFKTKERS
jgi:ribosomal protein S3